MMKSLTITGIGSFPSDYGDDLLDIETGGERQWKIGVNGVKRILGLRDKSVEFIIYDHHALAFVNSTMGYPAIYPLIPAAAKSPIRAVLMDLDGTTVDSEGFWTWIIERVTAQMLNSSRFNLKAEDIPFVTGRSVSENLNYCIKKYGVNASIEETLSCYYDLARHELRLIELGKGRKNAFQPCDGLREFLQAVRASGAKIGLVSSGLSEKAIPTITSVFRELELGRPLDYYDTIVTGGSRTMRGQFGTLGELESKPHPWLYAEAFRLGLGLDFTDRSSVLVLEDSSAGTVSGRLAGLPVIGLDSGNISSTGSRPLLFGYCHSLNEALQIILAID